MTNARKNDPKMLSTNYFWELYQKWDDAGKTRYGESPNQTMPCRKEELSPYRQHRTAG